jgi:hypothetical protein
MLAWQTYRNAQTEAVFTTRHHANSDPPLPGPAKKRSPKHQQRRDQRFSARLSMGSTTSMGSSSPRRSELPRLPPTLTSWTDDAGFPTAFPTHPARVAQGIEQPPPKR